MSRQESATLNSVSAIDESIRRHVKYSLGKAWHNLSTQDLFTAVALSVRDQLVERMLETEERYRQKGPKRLYYLSIEFLIGQSLGSNLHNLGVRELYRQALSDLGGNLEEVERCEEDAALGNGGLGRLAACFLDSLATLGMPGYGYGINYEYGIFKQEIDNGYQREKPDNWLAEGAPWQIARPDEACLVPIYGRIEHGVDRRGGYNPMWMDWKVLIGVPYDMLIAGYGGRTVNRLRLYAARSSRDFDMQIFNEGDYFKAVEQKIASETISKALYPSDAVGAGRELRLAQEYFLVACAIRDIVRSFQRNHNSFREFSAKVAIQLNDTHPSLAVAELMRILIDEKDLPWEEAWEITQASLGYTNHTLAPEALEKWPEPLLEWVLPRHLQIIYEINGRFLDRVKATYPGDVERQKRMSLIEESNPKQVRMANLAMVGSHSINGVSAIHDEYLSLIEDGRAPDAPRTYVFAGKAAPGYIAAKRIIKLIHNVGRVINNDLRAKEWIKVVFIPDYRVSLAEMIIPAADLSEQISTAGKEASGTSNMKFALNGALTIGTLDGANVEILEEVGQENIFIFGLKASEAQALRQQRSYHPLDYYQRHPQVKRVVEIFKSNLFCPQEPDLFAWVYSALLDENDEYFHMADLPAYLEAQKKAGAAFTERGAWTRMAILNVARIGKFSSDRTVTEYARDIWDIKSALN